MDIIMNYIDSMFAGVPVTPDTKRLREDITANMSDKFDELTKEGKSTNEAIGTVISEFGNIDEVLSELGVERVSDAKAKAVSPLRRFVKANIATLIMRPFAAFLFACFLFSRSGSVAVWGSTPFYYGFSWVDPGVIALFVAIVLALVTVKIRGMIKQPDFTAEQCEMLKKHITAIEKFRRIAGMSLTGILCAMLLYLTLMHNTSVWEILPYIRLAVCALLMLETYTENELILLRKAVGEPAAKRTAMYYVQRIALPCLIVAMTMKYHYLSGFDGGDDEQTRIFWICMLWESVSLYAVSLGAAFIFDKFRELKVR